MSSSLPGFLEIFMGCLRRHTFCQQRQKVCKKRRQNQGFEILSAPHAGNVVIMRPTRLENFARGLKCSIVSAVSRECPDWRSRSGRGSVDTTVFREDDAKFRPRPTDTLACRPERKSRNHAASCASFGNFLCEQKVPLRRHGHADSTANPAPKPTPLCRF